MKTLNVKSTTKKEVEENWKLNIPEHFRHKELFVRCNSKGVINWEVSPIYTKEELEDRGDYQIIVNLNINDFIEE